MDKLKIDDLVIVHYRDSNRIAKVVGFWEHCVQVKTIYDNRLRTVQSRNRTETYDSSYLEKITPELARSKSNFWATMETMLK